jgi:hypothetical protein
VHNFGAAVSRFLLIACPMFRRKSLRLLELLASAREVSENQMHTEQQMQQTITVPRNAASELIRRIKALEARRQTPRSRT